MTFTDTIKAVPGLTHYYPLAADAKDAVGTQHGTGTGVTFSSGKAVFNGAASISLGDHNDFSVATNKALSIALFLTIDDWHGKGASEYVHWAGKGKAGAHEWSFRHYVQGGTGEAPTRQGRCSFYHFNPAGGLGAGSYFQDGTLPTNERLIIATCDMSKIQLYVDGLLKDSDPLSGYSIVPQNTASAAMLGTRGDGTGFLVGKIRRVAFFNRILSAGDVSMINGARGQADTDPVVTPPPTDPLVLRDNATGSEIISAHNTLVAALKAKGSL